MAELISNTMTMILNNQNYQEFLNQVRQTNHPNQLPIVVVNLKRPKINFNSIVFFVIGMVFICFGRLSIQYSIGLSAVFVIMALLCFGGIYEQFIYHKFRINAKPNSYYIKLQPDGMIYCLEDELITISWQQFSMVQNFSGYRSKESYVTLHDKSNNHIEIFDLNIPIDYRKLSLFIHDYHIKAIGKEIILIK